MYRFLCSLKIYVQSNWEGWKKSNQKYQVIIYMHFAQSHSKYSHMLFSIFHYDTLILTLITIIFYFHVLDVNNPTVMKTECLQRTLCLYVDWKQRLHETQEAATTLLNPWVAEAAGGFGNRGRFVLRWRHCGFGIMEFGQMWTQHETIASKLLRIQNAEIFRLSSKNCNH